MPAADFGSPSTRRPVVSSGGTPVMWAASGPRLTFACRSAASPPAPAAGTAPSPAAGEGVARDVLLLVRPPETQSDHPPPLVPPHAAGHRHGRAARRTAGGRHRHDSDEKRLHTLLGAMCPARPWPRRTPPSERAAAKAKKNRAAARTPSAAPPGPAQSWSAPPVPRGTCGAGSHPAPHTGTGDRIHRTGPVHGPARLRRDTMRARPRNGRFAAAPQGTCVDPEAVGAFARTTVRMTHRQSARAGEPWHDAMARAGAGLRGPPGRVRGFHCRMEPGPLRPVRDYLPRGA